MKTLALFPLLIAGLLLGSIVPSQAAIIWTISGAVGPLATGNDDENLAGATLTLTVEVTPGVYGDWFGVLAFAPIASGTMTLSGSGTPANDATRPLELFPGGAGPIGYLPISASLTDSVGLPVAITLPSGNILTVAHGFSPPTPTGTAAMIGDTISASDFPVGTPGVASLTVAIQTAAGTTVITQYQSTFATYEVTETPTPAPEPRTLALFGLGLIGLGIARRRKAA